MLRPRGISLNRNVVNIQVPSSNSNLLTDNTLVKPQLVQPLQPQQSRPNDENFVPATVKGRESPNEPSPPKLRSYPRNSLRQHLPPQPKEPELKQLEPLAPLQPQQQLKSAQQPPEPVVSRIPRFSLSRVPVPHLSNRENVAANNKLSAKTSSKLMSMAEVEDEDEEPEGEIEDIDKPPTRDAIFLVCDLANDIYNYMYALEEAQSIREDYLKDQKILTPKVRQRLINWCIEINSQLKLLPETLYMTIMLIDRYFDRVTVKQQSQVQLVAVGATLIASKYEEIYPPDLGDLIVLTQNSYSRREIMRVEIQILETLNFDLGRPIPLAFLRRFSKAAQCDLKMHAIAKYLMELSLTEYECSHWKPSLLAAAALYTTIHLVHVDGSCGSTFPGSFARKLGVHQPPPQKERWTKTLVHYTHYSKKQLREPAGVLCKILKRAQKNPQNYASVKKNFASIPKWPELKSTRVDELVKLADNKKE